MRTITVRVIEQGGVVGIEYPVHPSTTIWRGDILTIGPDGCVRKVKNKDEEFIGIADHTKAALVDEDWYAEYQNELARHRGLIA